MIFDGQLNAYEPYNLARRLFTFIIFFVHWPSPTGREASDNDNEDKMKKKKKKKSKFYYFIYEI